MVPEFQSDYAKALRRDSECFRVFPCPPAPPAPPRRPQVILNRRNCSGVLHPGRYLVGINSIQDPLIKNIPHAQPTGDWLPVTAHCPACGGSLLYLILTDLPVSADFRSASIICISMTAWEAEFIGSVFFRTALIKSRAWASNGGRGLR